MNRAMRRRSNKIDRLANKADNKYRQSIGHNILNNPCCYCNSKPIYIGDAVFLKPQQDIPFKYDKHLHNLIKDKHRFVIIVHKGLGKGTCAIALLSTSDYLNKHKRRGIQLSGRYNSTKDVFVDAYNIWIIDVKSILQKDYSLTYEDAFKCSSMSNDSELPVRNVKIGTYNSLEVINAYDNYKAGLTSKADDELQYNIDLNNIKNLTSKLNVTQLIEIINAADPKIASYCNQLILTNIKLNKLKVTQESFTRWLANLCLHYDSGLNDLSKRGYFNYE